MSKLKTMITILVTLVSMVALSNIALATPPAVYTPNIGPVKSAPTVIQDNPIIKTFNVAPSQLVVQGSNVSISGLVTPGIGGSPIVQVTITANGATVFNYPSPSFTYNRLVNWYGDMTFAVTAKNAKGNVSTQSKVIKAVSVAEVLNKINVYNMEANPGKFMPGQPVDFIVTINNTNAGMIIGPVNIFVTQGSRVVANRTNTTLPNGYYNFQLQDTGFNASLGYYVVDIEFRGLHRMRSFKTKPITMYTIDPN